MSIDSLDLMKDATSGSITGGTALAFTDVGIDIPSGENRQSTTEENFLLNPSFTAKNRVHSKQPDGTYSKAKRTVSVVVPKELADGSIAYNLIRIEAEVHPETTAAETTNIWCLGEQVCSNASLADFRATGSLA